MGSGAVGGYTGGWLHHHGHDVTLIDFWPANIEAIRANGLQLDGLSEEERFTVTGVNALHVSDVQSLVRHPPIDIALVSIPMAWTAATVAAAPPAKLGSEEAFPPVRWASASA